MLQRQCQARLVILHPSSFGLGPLSSCCAPRAQSRPVLQAAADKESELLEAYVKERKQDPAKALEEAQM